MQSTRARLRIVGAALGGLWLVIAAPDPATADFKLCNRTDSNVGIAIGYKDEEGWKTEGWWNVGPNACSLLLDGSLASRFYYVYAVDYDLGGDWRGEAFMCTQDREFTIQGVADCEKRGYELTGFFEIDTGEATTWTVQLTEPGDRGIGGQ